MTNASLLDALIAAPNVNSNSAQQVVVRKDDVLINSIQRDLLDLLNTRSVMLPLPHECTSLPCSILSYGGVEVSGFNSCSEHDKQRLALLLERVIKEHETRFIQVNVKLLQQKEDNLTHGIGFCVDVMLHTDVFAENLSLQFLLFLDALTERFSMR